uniref:C-type lectin domain-containing protein n=1 Tax=Sander lucioperca TaxID=283035 RepID=A0A8D0D3H9_SANLU
MASGFQFDLLLCLSIGLLAPSCCGQTSSPGQYSISDSSTEVDQLHSVQSAAGRHNEGLLPPLSRELSSCPPGWTQFGSRCFSFNFQWKSWVDAESFCKAAGGNLASVHSEEEHVFLRTFINQVTGAYITSWMGGSDSVQEGVWMWSDGSTFDYKSWAWGQPDNFLLVEHCLLINYLGINWNDAPCNIILPFLCSKNL